MGGRAKFLMVALVVAASVALTGCGGGGSAAGAADTAGAAGAAPAPEELRASPAAVATGLKAIDGIAAQVAAAGTDTAKAKELVGQIEPQWYQIEGTVKANNPDMYLAFEDAFAVLEGAVEKGAAAAAAKGAQTVSTTAQGYLAKYPG